MLGAIGRGIGSVAGGAWAVVEGVAGAVSGARFQIGDTRIDLKNTDAKPMKPGAIEFAADWPNQVFGLPTMVAVGLMLVAVVLIGRSMR